MKIRDLSKHRDVWMGFAIAWVILYHSGLQLDFLPLRFIKRIGYGGVDVFLLASGLGCYYSLHKDDDLLGFMKRRFMRLAPVFFPFIVVWLIFDSFRSDMSLQGVVTNLLGLAALHGDYKWYISAQLLFYLLAPYMKKLADHVHGWKLLLTVLILIIFSIPFWNVRLFMIIVTRLPIFFIGMYMGRLCHEKERVVTKKQIAGGIAVMLVGLAVLLFLVTSVSGTDLWNWGLYWYPFILVTPGLCLCLSCVANAADRRRWLSWIPRILRIAGKNSFELYLIHAPLQEVLFYFIKRWGLQAYSNWLCLLYFAALIPALICFKWYAAKAWQLVGMLRRK